MQKKVMKILSLFIIVSFGDLTANAFVNLAPHTTSRGRSAIGVPRYQSSGSSSSQSPVGNTTDTFGSVNQDLNQDKFLVDLDQASPPFKTNQRRPPFEAEPRLAALAQRATELQAMYRDEIATIRSPTFKAGKTPVRAHGLSHEETVSKPAVSSEAVVELKEETTISTSQSVSAWNPEPKKGGAFSITVVGLALVTAAISQMDPVELAEYLYRINVAVEPTQIVEFKEQVYTQLITTPATIINDEFNKLQSVVEDQMAPLQTTFDTQLNDWNAWGMQTKTDITSELMTQYQAAKSMVQYSWEQSQAVLDQAMSEWREMQSTVASINVNQVTTQSSSLGSVLASKWEDVQSLVSEKVANPATSLQSQVSEQVANIQSLLLADRTFVVPSQVGNKITELQGESIPTTVDSLLNLIE